MKYSLPTLGPILFVINSIGWCRSSTAAFKLRFSQISFFTIARGLLAWRISSRLSLSKGLFLRARVTQVSLAKEGDRCLFDTFFGYSSVFHVLRVTLRLISVIDNLLLLRQSNLESLFRSRILSNQQSLATLCTKPSTGDMRYSVMR